MHKLCWGVLAYFQLQNVMANTDFDSLLAMNFDQLAAIEVTTASRSPQAWKDVQGSLWVVTEQEIKQRGYRHLADLLRDLPSVDVQGPYSTSSRVTVRGITGNTKLLILQDGVRIGAPAGELVPISINYPLYMAKQVEVLLTPGSALYGADAVTGVVNIISKHSQEQQTQQLSYEGSEARYQHGHLLLTGRVGQKYPLILGVHKEQFNNQSLAEQYPDVFAFDDLKNSQGKVIIPVNQRQSFQSLANAESVWATIKPHPSTELGVNYRVVSYPTDYTTLANFTDYGGFWEDRFLTLYGRYQQQISSQLSTNTLVTWSSYRLNKNSYFNNIFSGYMNGYKYAESKKMSIDSQWHYTLADQHQLMAGVVFDHLRAVPRTTDLSQPYDPNLSVEQQHLYYLGTNNSLPVKIFQVTQDNLGVFLQDQYQWSSQLSSQIGIRFDDNSDYKASTSPYLGLKYNYTPETTFSLTYSQAYLAPSPSYSYEHFGSFTGQQDSQGRYLADTFRVPNPDLQPETAKAVELIINQELNEHWQLISTAYGSHLQNLILFASPTANPVSEFINGGWIKNTDHNVNLGESVAYGVELSSRYWQQHYELWGHYSFTDGHLSTNKGEEELPYNAKHKLKLGATWHHKQGWFISPSMYFVGQSRVPSSASDGGRAITVPSYQLFNLYAGYPQIIQGIDVFMRIENIASSKYYHAGGSSKRSLVQLPQLDRTITLGFEVDF